MVCSYGTLMSYNDRSTQCKQDILGNLKILDRSGHLNLYEFRLYKIHAFVRFCTICLQSCFLMRSCRDAFLKVEMLSILHDKKHCVLARDAEKTARCNAAAKLCRPIIASTFT